MIGSLCAAAALLLIGSGLAKMRSPQHSLATVGVVLRHNVSGRSVRIALVRALAGAEMAAGAGFLAVGGRVPAIAMALLFAMFAGIAATLLAAPGRVSCGCFGRPDAPVGVTHVIVNVLSCAAAVTCAVRPVGPLAGFMTSSALVTIVGLTQVVLLAALGFLSMTALPAMTAAGRLGAAR